MMTARELAAALRVWGMLTRQQLADNLADELPDVVSAWQGLAGAWRQVDAEIREALLDRLRELPGGRLDVGEVVYYGERVKKVKILEPHRAFARVAEILRPDLEAETPSELADSEVMAWQLEELARRVLSTGALKPAAARKVLELTGEAEDYIKETWPDKLASGKAPVRLGISNRRFLEGGGK